MKCTNQRGLCRHDTLFAPRRQLPRAAETGDHGRDCGDYLTVMIRDALRPVATSVTTTVSFVPGCTL